MRRSVSFNLQPEVNFYKRRDQHAEPEEEPERRVVLAPVADLPPPPKIENTFEVTPITEGLTLQLQPLELQPLELQPLEPLSPSRPPPLNLSLFSHSSPPLHPVEQVGEISPLIQAEIRIAREHEAAIRAQAIATAYQQFATSATPDEHMTPASVTSLPRQYVSPLILSPVGSPKGQQTPRA